MTFGQKVDYTYTKENTVIILIQKGQQNNEEPLPVLIIMFNYVFTVMTKIEPRL